MPSTARIRRKDLRRPDEFVTLTNRSMAYVKEHSRQVGWIAAVAAVALIAVIAFFSARSNQARRASDVLGRGLGAFKGGNYEEAIAEFRNYGDESSHSPIGPPQLYVGEAQLATGKYDDAAAALQKAAPEAQVPYVRQSGLVSLGYALEEKKDYAGAADRFHAAAEISGPYTAVAVLGEARNRELAGDKAAAKEAYSRYIQEYPQAPERAMAEARRDRL